MNGVSEYSKSHPQTAIEAFCRLLAEEISFRQRQGMDNSYLKLKYENYLIADNRKLNRMILESYAARLVPLLRELSSAKNLKILDAGCGCGSESLLFGLLGAEVSGLDLVAQRNAYAISRLPFYQAKMDGNLKVQFICGNVLKHLPTVPGYDVIWANESISHIHPAPEFVRLAYHNLKPGGLLAISDSNAFNIMARIRAARIRGKKDWYVLRQFPLLDEGQHDEVAEERLFSVFALKKILKDAGFSIRRVAMFGFMGSSLFPRSWHEKENLAKAMKIFQNVMTNIPLLRWLGSGMTMIAEK